MTLWKTPGHMAQTHSPRGLHRDACDFITVLYSSAMQGYGGASMRPGRVITAFNPALTSARG
jgi:hypothetical protein